MVKKLDDAHDHCVSCLRWAPVIMKNQQSTAVRHKMGLRSMVRLRQVLLPRFRYVTLLRPTVSI